MPSDNEDQNSPNAELRKHNRLTLSKRWKWIPKVFYALGAVGLVLGVPFWAEGLAFYLRWLGVLYDTFGRFEIWTWLMIVAVHVYLFAIGRTVIMAYSDLADLSGRHLTTVRLLRELAAQVKQLERRLDDVEK